MPSLLPTPPEQRRPPLRRLAVGSSLAVLLAAGVLLAATYVLPGAPVPLGVLARGERSSVAVVRWSGWPPASAAEHDALNGALSRPALFRALVRRYPGLLAVQPRVAVAKTAGPTVLALDEFPPSIEPTSEIVVLWQCSPMGGRFAVRLSTLVQDDTSIVPAPLTSISGRCGADPQLIRYRPIRGIVPAFAQLRAPHGRLAVLLTSR